MRPWCCPNHLPPTPNLLEYQTSKNELLDPCAAGMCQLNDPSCSSLLEAINFSSFTRWFPGNQTLRLTDAQRSIQLSDQNFRPTFTDAGQLAVHRLFFRIFRFPFQGKFEEPDESAKTIRRKLAPKSVTEALLSSGGINCSSPKLTDCRWRSCLSSESGCRQ